MHVFLGILGGLDLVITESKQIESETIYQKPFLLFLLKL